MPSVMTMKIVALLFGLAVIGAMVVTINHWKDRARTAEGELAGILVEVRLMADNPKLKRAGIIEQLARHRVDDIELEAAVQRAKDSVERLGVESVRRQREASEAGVAAAGRRRAAEAARDEALASAARPSATPCEPSSVVKRRWK